MAPTSDVIDVIDPIRVEGTGLLGLIVQPLPLPPRHTVAMASAESSVEMSTRARQYRRRRVDLLLPSLNPGGAQQVYLTLSRLLADYHDVRLVVVNQKGPLRHEIPEGVTVVDLERPAVRRALPALVRHIRRSTPDVLLSSMDHTNVLAVTAARLSGRRLLVLPRIANTLTRSQSRRALSSVVVRRVSRAMYRRMPAVIVPSEGVARDLLRLDVPSTTVRVVPNPVVSPSLLAAAKGPVSHSWFDPKAREAKPLVVAMGRLVRQKDMCVLLEAFAKVRAKRDARLVILGDGPERPALARQAAEIGVEEDFDMPGYVDDPFPYLSRADLFVLSSRWEGLPGALIQALACGAPVVATDCESGPREILADGRFGRLVPVGDVAALATAIELSLAHPARPSPEAWWPYTEETALRAYLDLIEEVSSELGAQA